MCKIQSDLNRNSSIIFELRIFNLNIIIKTNLIFYKDTHSKL